MGSKVTRQIQHNTGDYINSNKNRLFRQSEFRSDQQPTRTQNNNDFPKENNEEIKKQDYFSQSKRFVMKAQEQFIDRIKKMANFFIKEDEIETLLKKMTDAKMNKEIAFSFRGLRFVSLYNQTVNQKITKIQMNKKLQNYLWKKTGMSFADIRNQIRLGNIQINREKLDANNLPYQTLQENDLLTFRTFQRTEPPIYDLPIKYKEINNANKIIQVNKPPSMPVFFNQTYFKNVLSYILRRDYFKDQNIICVVQPLERQASGLTLLSRKELEPIERFQISKEYKNSCLQRSFYIRVSGKLFKNQLKLTYQPQTKLFIGLPFPQKKFLANMLDPRKQNFIGLEEEEEEEVPFQKEISPIDIEFELIDYDENSDTSLINCKITSSKFMMKIREGLANLGNPVINDLSFNGKFIGNQWLEKFNQDIFNDEIKQKYREEIVARKQYIEQKMKEKIEMDSKQLQEGEQRRFIHIHNLEMDQFEWDICKIFELYIHGYKYEYNIKGVKETYELENSDNPYWYDAKNLTL